MYIQTAPDNRRFLSWGSRDDASATLPDQTAQDEYDGQPPDITVDEFVEWFHDPQQSTLREVLRQRVDEALAGLDKLYAEQTKRSKQQILNAQKRRVDADVKSRAASAKVTARQRDRRAQQVQRYAEKNSSRIQAWNAERAAARKDGQKHWAKLCAHDPTARAEHTSSPVTAATRSWFRAASPPSAPAFTEAPDGSSGAGVGAGGTVDAQQAPECSSDDQHQQAATATATMVQSTTLCTFENLWTRVCTHRLPGYRHET